MNDQLALPLDLTPGEHDAYVIKDRSIAFKAEITQPEWENIARQLAELSSHTATAHVRIMFLLGDALNFGERTYGEDAAQAIDATREHMRLNMKTVENAAWVASSVPPENRHELLSMAHHEAVARLTVTQQRELLDEAQDEALPVSKLRKRVKEVSPPTRAKKIKAKTKAGKDDITTEEDAVEAADTLATFAAPYVGRRASEITPKMRKAFDEHMTILYGFCRRFIRKKGW